MGAFCFLMLIFFQFAQDAHSEVEEGESFREDAYREKLAHELDSFFDEKVDYARFRGRISDKDSSDFILKIATENPNIKFLYAGDLVYFRPSLKKRELCEGHVRSVAPGYLTIYVKNFSPCELKRGEILRRGTILSLSSPVLVERVKAASLDRISLMRRKEDFLRQLDRANHFLASFEQEKVQVAAEIDKRILDLTREKEKALFALLSKKRDQVRLQRELIKNLDDIDRNLERTLVENPPPLTERWRADQDLGLPVGMSPQNLLEKANLPKESRH